MYEIQNKFPILPMFSFFHSHEANFRQFFRPFFNKISLQLLENEYFESFNTFK